MPKLRWTVSWPRPLDRDEDDQMIKEIDHTDDDPGPEDLAPPQLRPTEQVYE
jgi:hypothetical protein